MEQKTYIITFDNASAADSNRYALELRNTLLDATPDLKVELKREDPLTQNFGDMLVLLLGTPTIVVATKALGGWLMRNRRSEITIKTPQGEIIGKNLTSKDAMMLAELLLSHK